MVKSLKATGMQRERKKLKDQRRLPTQLISPTSQPRRQESTENANVFLTGSVLSDRSLRSCLRLCNPIGDARVIFFDLDNTLYSKNTGVAEEMGHRIKLYFEQFLHLPKEEAASLGRKYYLDYGLAIKGLIHDFQIDPTHYDNFVDGGLQLDKALKPDTRLVSLLTRIKARKWIFTNAGLTHALRVLRLLGVEDQFEGIIYCDYSEPNFPAKPDRLAYERAMRSAGTTADQCYFIDDSVSNVRTAIELGWRAIHLDEQRDSGMCQYSANLHTSPPAITSLEEISNVLSELFQASSEPATLPPLSEVPLLLNQTRCEK